MAITVTDVAEAPGVVAAPTVVSTDSDNDKTTYDLKVVWYAPDDKGDEVTGYDVQYKKTTAASFTDFDHDGTDTSANIGDLDADTSYQVRVRATNSVGNGPWSLSSTGSTNKKDNELPTFGDTAITLDVSENAEAGLVVGTPVSATDDDNVLPLSYRLHGPDANSFDLQASTGQIRTKRGVVYDFETKPTLNVTMTVSDGQGGTDATAVTISVTDVPEAPSKPDRPTVRATQGSSRSLDVSWKAPANTGPAITGYDLRYRKGSSGSFTRIQLTGTGTTHTIAPTDDDLSDGDDRLTPGASYEVSVRAKSPEKTVGGEWSAAGTGRTSAGNKEPVFNDRSSPDETNPTTSRTVAENTRAGQSVGRAVSASDGNGDKRTYRLFQSEDTDTARAQLAKFDINESTGQILTKAALNHEASDCGYVNAANPTVCTYTVKVQVWDGLDTHRNEEATVTVDDTITVSIKVSDVAEKPAAPLVTVTSPATGTDLTVTWTAPDNTGPAITGYRLECTGTEVPDDQCPKDDIAENAVSHTITGLTANKSYRVRLRAESDEGDGAWSSWVTQSTNKANNSLPTFTSQPSPLYVVEDAPSARQSLTTDSNGQTVASLEGDDTDGDTLTLRLEGPGASRFDIDNTSGQIRTKSKLNYEDAASYAVRVKLSDPNGGSIFYALTINVTDKEEPPAKPSAPRVTATSGSGWSLEVTWSEPRNQGPAITGYQIRYRKTGDSTAAWQSWSHTGAGRSAKITTIRTTPTDDTTAVHLDPSTQYEVQVRALNGEGDSTFADATNWSSSGRGTTGKGNRRPAFKSTASVVELEVEENTRSGQNVGSAVEAEDADKNNSLTYTLEGPGKDSFTITSAGQIRTRSPLNYEERNKYSLTVKVDDRQGKNNSVAAKSVTITVTDRTEVPSAPSAPKVSGIPGSTDSVRVTWDEPANTGPPITHYNVQWAISGSRDAWNWQTIPTGRADRSAVIPLLTAGTRYQVRVRAHSVEGHSDWSSSGTGSPNPDQENRKPAFSTRSYTFSVAENTSPGADVGDLVAALDPDGDTLTYALEGVDADSFDIIVSSGAGQIQTKAALNYEDKASYSVAVRARDGRGGTDAVNVTIRVTDVDDEAPDTPFAPSVTALSSTSIQVNWEAPENDGPPITDYDYRYKAFGTADWTEVTNTTIAGTTATIEGLTASTSYDVEVRAKNAEGTSEWSNPGNGATNEPGANNAPVFTDGTSATRSVSASAPTGTPIGDPIAAKDADSGDKLTYTLEGRDAASFSINEKTGQLLTKTGVTLIVGETYTVTVAASDTKDTTRIDVSIAATAAPPNRPPAFSGTSRSLTVLDNASAGSTIGTVRATDPDGDNLTYSLEGANAASFDIRSTSTGGQIVTKSGVILVVGASYSVTVDASDGTASAKIAVTITVSASNRPPAFSGTSRSFTVLDNAEAGSDVGDPVTARDPDGDSLTYSLEGTNAASFDIGSSTGQIVTKSGVTLTAGAALSVTVVASDGTASAKIGVTITVVAPPNNAPVFDEGESATRSVRDIAMPFTEIGEPVTATDADGDTPTYTLKGTDAASFEIRPSTGQLFTIPGVTLTEGATHSVTVVASDGKDSAEIAITIEVLGPPNNEPVFDEGASASRSVPVNAEAGANVGDPVDATDADEDDTLTYSLDGTDKDSFEIDSSTGQLFTKSGVTLTVGASHSVTVVANDGEDTASIAVTIRVVPPPNNVPAFDEGETATRSVRDNATPFTNVGEPVTATDADEDDTLTYTLEGEDAASFVILPDSGQIFTKPGVTLTEGATHSVTVVANDGKDKGRIAVTIEILGPPNNPPAFDEGESASRRVRANAEAGSSIGSPVTATDADEDDTLTYSLDGTDKDSFEIGSSTGQIVTKSGVTLTAGATHDVTVVVNDEEATTSIAVTITVIPGLFGCDTQGSAVSDKSNKGLVADCEALLASRNALEGTARLNWSLSTSIKEWQGITVSGTPERVTRLNLRSSGLNGTLPAELGQLTMLERLWLHNNSLSGPIPDLSGLQNLKMLWLSGKNMELSGPVPAWLNNLRGLESLSLWGNNLSGSIPDLSRMDSLDLLKLQSNNLSGGIPASLGSMRSLRGLYLHNNPLGGSIPAELNGLSTLTILGLNEAQLTGPIPDLSGLTKLRTLNLRNNSLTGPIPAWLGDLDSLVYLMLHNNKLSGTIPADLGDLPNLQRLALSNNSTDGRHPVRAGRSEQAEAAVAVEEPVARGHPDGAWRSWATR